MGNIKSKIGKGGLRAYGGARSTNSNISRIGLFKKEAMYLAIGEKEKVPDSEYS